MGICLVNFCLFFLEWSNLNLPSTVLLYPLLSHSLFISLIKKGGKKSRKFSRRKEVDMMACFVPFNNRNLEICFLVFRPTIVLVDDLLESLKDFCLFTESIGCLHSAVFTSIHGNMVRILLFHFHFSRINGIICAIGILCVQMIWYGTWMKRSNEDKELLTSAFVSLFYD